MCVLFCRSKNWNCGVVHYWVECSHLSLYRWTLSGMKWWSGREITVDGDRSTERKIRGVCDPCCVHWVECSGAPDAVRHARMLVKYGVTVFTNAAPSSSLPVSYKWRSTHRLICFDHLLSRQKRYFNILITSGQRISTKGRVVCRAVIEDWMILCFSMGRETPKNCLFPWRNVDPMISWANTSQPSNLDQFSRFCIAHHQHADRRNVRHL